MDNEIEFWYWQLSEVLFEVRNTDAHTFYIYLYFVIKDSHNVSVNVSVNVSAFLTTKTSLRTLKIGRLIFVLGGLFLKFTRYPASPYMQSNQKVPHKHCRFMGALRKFFQRQSFFAFYAPPSHVCCPLTTVAFSSTENTDTSDWHKWFNFVIFVNFKWPQTATIYSYI